MTKNNKGKMKYNKNLVNDRDYSEECLVCGRKVGKFYHYDDGWDSYLEGPLTPEEAQCYTCGFSWAQCGENYIDRIYKEAKEYIKK